MKSKIKILFIFLAIMLLSCCGRVKHNSQKSWYEIGSDGAMIEVFEKEMNNRQLDSLFIADTLPNRLDKWLMNRNKDNHGNIITKYFMVKDRPAMDTYIVYGKTDSTYIVTKRIIELEKE